MTSPSSYNSDRCSAGNGEPTDRDWFALNYALGELSESEAVAFEAELAQSVGACEELAEQQRLLELTRAALTQTPPVPSVRRQPTLPAKGTRRRVLAIVNLLCVGLVCVAGVWVVQRWNAAKPPGESAGQAVAETTNVANTEGLDAATAISFWRQDVGVSETGDAEVVPTARQSVGSVEEETSPDISEWMISAMDEIEIDWESLDMDLPNEVVQ